jgi:hypothetical protein
MPIPILSLSSISNTSGHLPLLVIALEEKYFIKISLNMYTVYVSSILQYRLYPLHGK